MRKLVTISVAILFFMTSCQKEDLLTNQIQSASVQTPVAPPPLQPNYGTTAVDKDINPPPTDPVIYNVDNTQKYTITEYLKSDNSLLMAYTILVRTGMDKEIDEGEYYTFFAPTNNAISKYLSNNDYNSLEDVPMNILTQIVKSHISDMTVKVEELEQGIFVSTLLYGKKVFINVDNPDSPLVVTDYSEAKIIKSDYSLKNGIIHKTNSVLIL